MSDEIRPQDALLGRSGRSDSGATPPTRKKAPSPTAAPIESIPEPDDSDPSDRDPSNSDSSDSAVGGAATGRGQSTEAADSGAGVVTITDPAPPQAETIERSKLDPADRRLAGFIGSAVLLGFVLRIVALGERALHHDESLDAWWSYRYLNGTYDGYDPVYHGPLRFYITAFFYWLFGESPATSRLFSALAGTALIATAWFLRNHIGRLAAGATAAALCLSPSLLYYSRFGREDAQIVFLTAVMLVATIAYFTKPKPWLPSLILLALSASLAIKESTYLLIFTVGSFVLVVLAVQFQRLATSDADGSDSAPVGQGSFSWQLPIAALALMVLAVILAAQSSAFLMFGLYGAVLVVVALIFAQRASANGRTLTEAPLVAKVAEVGAGPWIVGLVLFLFSFLAFFTVWFTRPGDWHTGVTEAIEYWDSQQEVNRGGQPWYYYFVVMPAYEWVAIGLAFVGAEVAFRKRSFALGLVGWLAVSSMIVYSYAGERMPWLVVHPLLPVLILAGVGLQRLWVSRDNIGPKVAMSVFALGFLFTVFSGLRLSFANGTDGRELLVQGAQATDHVPLVVDYVEALEDLARVELGREPQVAVGNELSWPWGWYFRDLGYLPFTDSGDLPDSDIILRAASQGVSDEIRAEYDVTFFALRSWWVPAWDSKQVERENEVTGVVETTSESTVGGYFGGNIGGWINWQVDRTAWPEGEGLDIGCGSADQYLLVRKDLAAAAQEAIGYGLLKPLVIEPLPCVSSALRSTS